MVAILCFKQFLTFKKLSSKIEAMQKHVLNDICKEDNVIS